jgi:hypothetical protein
MVAFILTLLISFNSIAEDALLEAMFANWNRQEEETLSEPDAEKSDESEAYHWELGTPDNIPEIEVIYDEPSPCQLGY